MTGVIICLAIIALAEIVAVYNQIRNKHLVDEIGRLENLLLSERAKFEDAQKNHFQEMVALRKENNDLKNCLIRQQTGEEYVGTETDR
jgi:hypothetical protein